MKVKNNNALYISKKENKKIEKMIDDLEDFLVKMEKQGVVSSNISFKHLVDAQDNLEMFLDNIEHIDEE